MKKFILGLTLMLGVFMANAGLCAPAKTEAVAHHFATTPVKTKIIWLKLCPMGRANCIKDHGHIISTCLHEGADENPNVKVCLQGCSI